MSAYIWLIYGVASAVTLVVAALRVCDDRQDRVRGALILALGWIAYNQFQFIKVELAYPLLDALIGYMVAALWMQQPARWKAAIFVCTIMQLVAHVIYQVALALDVENRYLYQAALNALFVCQLLCVNGSGLLRGLRNIAGMLGNRVGDRMPVHGMARDAAR